MEIAPSILDIDFTEISDVLSSFREGGFKYLHLDIMDGVYVPNISFGIPIVRTVRKHSDFILDTHLMIADPANLVEEFIDAGSDIVTFHYEAVTHHDKVLKSIKERGKRAGIALNPATPVNVLDEVIDTLDLVLLMSVNPGFGGQKFINSIFDKIERLKRRFPESNFLIEVDGGIDADIALKLKKKGVDICVVGSYLTDEEDLKAKIKEIIDVLK